MEKGEIIKVKNQEDFMYFQIKPNVSVAYILDEISSTLDEYNEAPKYLYKNINYNELVPSRETFHTGEGEIYAIAVYSSDLIDLILFKNNSKFKKVIELMKEHFVYLDGKSF